jgi:TolB-like protein
MEYLSAEERKQLQTLRATNSFVDEVLCQLQLILTSSRFKRVQKNAKRFLGFIVTRALLGGEGEITGKLIGARIYSEKIECYSTKIRVAAAGLRKRVTEYYANEGQNDSIEIVVPVGQYIPEIRDRRPSLAVTVFENWSPVGEQAHLCTGLSDDMAYQLQEAGVRVSRTLSGEDGRSQPRYGLRGSLECGGELLRINISVGDCLSGVIVYAASFEQRRDYMLHVSRQAAEAIARALYSATGMHQMSRIPSSARHIV